MKAFHLLLFQGSFIFLECILIFGLILLLMIDLTSDQKDRPWFYFISSTSLLQNVSVYVPTYCLDIPREIYGLMRLL
ncbi:hypothetical protein DAI22_04g095160 [Oryza sativa Japonica Group]|nr:hypothetical protein DAI22_04g095160 [Oryza sativa Japonica Group]